MNPEEKTNIIITIIIIFSLIIGTPKIPQAPIIRNYKQTLVITVISC